jgi:hypothetical protein
MHNALDVIALQRAVHLFVEHGIRHAVIRSAAIAARRVDLYYGLVHVVVPGVALVYLWRHFPERYPTWRTPRGAPDVALAMGTRTESRRRACYP